MLYKVGNKEFNTFEEVVTWAWNEYKIEFYDHDNDMGEIDKECACAQLGAVIFELEDSV